MKLKFFIRWFLFLLTGFLCCMYQKARFSLLLSEVDKEAKTICFLQEEIRQLSADLTHMQTLSSLQKNCSPSLCPLAPSRLFIWHVPFLSHHEK